MTGLFHSQILFIFNLNGAQNITTIVNNVAKSTQNSNSSKTFMSADPDDSKIHPVLIKHNTQNRFLGI